MDELTVPVELPTRAECIYLEEFRLGAIVVLAGRANAPVAIIATGNLADALSAARRSWPRDDLPSIAAVSWAPSVRLAQQVAALAVANDLRTAGQAEGRFCVDAPTAFAAIQDAAAWLSVKLVDHKTVLARARTGASAIGLQVGAAQDKGALRDFNLRYKQARLLAEKENRPFLTYSMARQRLEAALAVCAATGAAIDFKRIFEDMAHPRASEMDGGGR
jgi:hypothetical protein